MPELSGETAALVEHVSNPAVSIVMHLAKNAFAADLESVLLADFVECDFPGYAPIRLTEFIAEDTDNAALGEVVSEYAEFVAGDLVDPQQISAVYVTQQVGDNPAQLLWPYFPDFPVLMTKKGETYRKRFRLTSLADVEI